MHYHDIKRHLLPYRIYQRRKTTINHAFAAAVAPTDTFDAETVERAIILLGQNPDEELRCVYCDSPAETWDHVFATVHASAFSGAGHRIGNLLPCCKPCNSKKGNKSWEAFLCAREEAGPAREKRLAAIRLYLDTLFTADPLPTSLPEYARLITLRDQILSLMKEADEVASTIRDKMKS